MHLNDERMNAGSFASSRNATPLLHVISHLHWPWLRIVISMLIINFSATCFVQAFPIHVIVFMGLVRDEKSNALDRLYSYLTKGCMDAAVETLDG